MTDVAAPLRLLIVDDDDVDREQIRRLIERCSLTAHLTESEDAASALALSWTGGFDCVLLDNRLPDVDGLELVEEITKSSTAVVMLTGLGNEAIAVEAMKRGAKDYLLKDSLTSDSLRRSIVNATEKVHLEREIREKNRRLEEMSLYDSLTGLPNRNLFFDRLEQSLRSAKRENQRFAIFMMDLDLFKEINDTYGHEIGNELLRVVAERLSETLRDSDTAARLGGDEFAALLPSIDSLEGAAVLAERVQEVVARPMVLNGRVLEVGISIGIGLFPDHGHCGKSLLHAADMAMYEAKKACKGFVACESDLDLHSRFESLLPKHLGEGMKRNEFILHYQPKVELRTARISGAEALVRWTHPDFGLLPPVEFIPGAERTALIRPLTMLILDQAAEQMMRWREEGRALPVAVNLSPRLLANKNLPEQIIETLDRHGLPPSALTLEITENGIMTGAALATDLLQEIADCGVRISIDDFGTGYTSLRYLRELPISELKIDQLYIKDLQAGTKDASIVRSIIELSKGLGIAVVSEGIETSQVWHELLALGCDFGQGFGIARPMPADEFEAFRAEWEDQVPPRVEPLPGVSEGLRQIEA